VALCQITCLFTWISSSLI